MVNSTKIHIESKMSNGNRVFLNGPKDTVDIGNLCEQILQDCKLIYKVFSELLGESSLKHLELCCDTFSLNSNAVNVKFKILHWYNDIKEYVEKNRPPPSKGKKNRHVKGFIKSICPCFGSKVNPLKNTTSENSLNPTHTI